MELWGREDRVWAFQVAPITVGRKGRKKKNPGSYIPKFDEDSGRQKSKESGSLD